MNIPEFWKTSAEYVDEAYINARRAQKRVIARSPGGRNVYALCYGGERARKGTANYSSALGAGDKAYFSPLGKARPVVVLIGAVHGQETEGVAALMNLIALMETGADIAGVKHEELARAAERARLVIVPIANPDGRARVKPESIIGMTLADLRYWGQGTWKDGSLCGWPQCKSVHPIKSDAGFLGGYFNDDGVNIMHDDFFNPMARETVALLDLCRDEQADIVIHLHGGGNSKGALLQPHYVTEDVNEAISELAERLRAAGAKEGLEFDASPPPKRARGVNPPTFNLVSAAHHVCGAVSVCYESNQGLSDGPPPRLTHAQVTRMHMLLFTHAINLAADRLAAEAACR